MKIWKMLQRSARHAMLGVIGFGCSLIGLMGYYPAVPAFFAANCLMGENSVMLYVGLLAGMGYFLSITAIAKYVVALVAIAVGLRFFQWVNRSAGAKAAGIIAGGIVAVLNVSGGVAGAAGQSELLLGCSEGFLTAGLTMAFYYVLIRLPQTARVMARVLPKEEELAEAHAGRQEEKAAAFASALDGLSAVFTSMKDTREKTECENVGALAKELTGKLCVSCDGCAVCWNETNPDMSARIRRMLKDVVARQPKDHIVESSYVKACPHYPRMVEEAVGAFERMELNRAWYRRLLENRLAIAEQLDAIAQLMGEWSVSDRKVDDKNRLLIARIALEAGEKGIAAEDIHVFEDAKERISIEASVSSRWGGGIPSAIYVKALEKASGRHLRARRGQKSLITGDPVQYAVYEDTVYYAMDGVSVKAKDGSLVSGDNYAMFTLENGRHFVCLSDGMGSGAGACKESELVVDLIEKFMEAGFSEEIAIRMMNSAMVLKGEDRAYSTLDLCDIDLYEGELICYKIGAAASFLRRGEEAEYIASGSLPAGAKLDMEPRVLRRRVESGDFLVMVSDGVLEYLHVKNPEEKFAEILSEIRADNANVLAQKAMERVLMFTGGYAMDDMTILATGIWEK